MNKILILDNYDSFTYNLVHMVAALSPDELVVKRNDKISISEAMDFNYIILSPGPGLPSEAGIMSALVKEAAPKKKILGVCLGHQCIGEVFGGTLKNLSAVVHGKELDTSLSEPSKIFDGLPKKFKTGRYHSWVVDKKEIPSSLTVTAVDDAGEVMALQHKEYNVFGVQFHPESILTEHGAAMIKNFLSV